MVFWVCSDANKLPWIYWYHVALLELVGDLAPGLFTVLKYGTASNGISVRLVSYTCTVHL
jgi:hypothetical protein